MLTHTHVDTLSSTRTYIYVSPVGMHTHIEKLTQICLCIIATI